MNILITGGASGLGEAITRTLLSEENNTVFFTYSNSELKAKEIESAFSNANSLKCDFKKPKEVKGIVDKIEKFNIDVLINNAYTGKVIHNHFHKIDQEDFLRDFKNSIIPTIQITQAAIAYFRKKKGGKIITVLTSILENSPPIGTSCYVANKAYLKSLVKSWTSENIKHNITSNSVSPAFMQTALTSDVDDRIIEQMQSNHPLKKLLTVEEVADTVLFLTKASAHINGVDILMNSGVNIK